MVKKIDIPYANIHYEEGDKYILKVVTWLIAEEDGTPSVRTGLVVMEAEDDMVVVLNEIHEKQSKLYDIVSANVMDFSMLIEGLKDEHIAYHILRDFDEHVDSDADDR